MVCHLFVLAALVLSLPSILAHPLDASLQHATGDFILQANVSECKAAVRSGSNAVEIVFDARTSTLSSTSTYSSYSLEPSSGTIEFIRYRNGAKSVLQTVTTDPTKWNDNGTAPLRIELLRRGTFYLLYLGGSHLDSQPITYVQRPSSEVMCSSGGNSVEHELEPLSAFTGFKDVSGGVFQLNSLTVQPFRFEAAELPSAPVLTHCPTCGVTCDLAHGKTDGCWAFNQVIPGGGLLQTPNGSFVLYVAAQDYNGNDGGGKARMGVATGPSLDQLSLHPEFVLEGTPGALDERSIFPNGALVLNNGTVVVTYMGQAADDSWGGIFLASSACAIGCAWYKHGVVLGCAQHNATGADPQVCGAATSRARPIHEHDLLRLPNGTFVLFYAGNTAPGDQGFLATADDMRGPWRNYAGNPALPLPLKECGAYPDSTCWDGEHRRPRSLLKFKDWWYLLYEGTTHHPSSLGGCWGDTIGLMRSKTLEGPYVERHPLQIIVPSQPNARFDSTWTGWPRAHISEITGELLVLYAAGGRDMQDSSKGIHDFASTGLRRWSLEKLTNWSGS